MRSITVFCHFTYFESRLAQIYHQKFVHPRNYSVKVFPSPALNMKKYANTGIVNRVIFNFYLSIPLSPIFNFISIPSLSFNNFFPFLPPIYFLLHVMIKQYIVRKLDQRVLIKILSHRNKQTCEN